jgi:hypothetical protein
MDNCYKKPVTDNGVGPLEYIRKVWGSNFGSETGSLIALMWYVHSLQTKAQWYL